MRGTAQSFIAGNLSELTARRYLGNSLGLYRRLRELCKDGRSTTAIGLANAADLDVRWVREWCAQQAAMGFLELMDGEGQSDADLKWPV